MKNMRKRVISFIISLVLFLLSVSVTAPKEEALAASKYIKVEAFIQYFVTELKLQLDENSKTPYIDAALKAGILKEGDFKDYKEYLTRTDCAVLANRIDKYVYGEHFGYADEVYEFLKDCEYVDGKLYYNVENGLYPKGMTSTTYPAANFLNEVILPRISPYFKLKDTLNVWYYRKSDFDGNMLAKYIEVGLNNGTISGMDPFNENDAIILAWQRIVDGERKFTDVYNKRISDLSKITKSRRQDVAEVVAKGIINGYSNGKYIQNRSFKGSNKIKVSGAKNVVKLAMDKYARAPISPDGQLIRTTKLPKNAGDFPYILECFPNEFYEMIFYFQRLNSFKDDTMKREYYKYPNEVGNNFIVKEYSDAISVGMEPYEFYDTIMKQAEQYLNCVFNVDYRTVGKDWSENVANSYMPFGGDNIYDDINHYIKVMEKNHVIVENKIISLEPSTLYVVDNDFYIRAYVKYRITADTVKVEDDFELLFGSLYSTYLVGIKNGEWTYGYYDIKLGVSNVNDINYLEFGMDPWAGISDQPLKGDK
ncbi:MAG: hypothetical protein K0S01_1663 [Herbinix sp.]|jgi:hypothetical protein|nr:hypothetical protein [Herbinix sp.]